RQLGQRRGGGQEIAAPAEADDADQQQVQRREAVGVAHPLAAGGEITPWLPRAGRARVGASLLAIPVRDPGPGTRDPGPGKARRDICQGGAIASKLAPTGALTGGLRRHVQSSSMPASRLSASA